MKTYVLFHVKDFAQTLLVALETFKTFLAGLPTVFSALLAETTTFQPFSRQASVDSGPPTVFQAWLSACLFNALRRYAFWFFNCPPFLHNLHNSTSRSAQFQARSYPCKHVIAQRSVLLGKSPIFLEFQEICNVFCSNDNLLCGSKEAKNQVLRQILSEVFLRAT